MAIPAALAVVPIGLLFILSGLVVNLIQALVYILVRTVSKNSYRKINKRIAELLWLELIWLIDWWAGVKVEVYADSQTFQMMGQEHALLICNHRSDIDWLIGWVMAQRAGCLGSALAIMKKSAKFLPIIGWSMWFSDYIFLDRSWAKDETTLKSGFQRLADFPMPFWLALFVEGTRFTKGKLLAAQEYAASRGLPIPRNVLIPRTKYLIVNMILSFLHKRTSSNLLNYTRGFVTAVTHMRSYVPAIYDCTVDISRAHPAPSMLGIIRGKSSVVKLQIKRHPMQELPTTSDGIAQWCKDVFVTKDAFLENYRTKDLFSNLPLQDIRRPKSSLIVVSCWWCLLACGIVKFFQWSSMLSSWQGILVVGLILLVVAVVMQILIQSSESQRSTPVEALQKKDTARERLLHK